MYEDIDIEGYFKNISDEVQKKIDELHLAYKIAPHVVDLVLREIRQPKKLSKEKVSTELAKKAKKVVSSQIKKDGYEISDSESEAVADTVIDAVLEYEDIPPPSPEKIEKKLCLTSNGVLQHPFHSSSYFKKLNIQQELLIRSLNNKSWTKTTKLVELTGYKNTGVVRSEINKLNKTISFWFGFYMIDGDQFEGGYRLSHQIKWNILPKSKARG